MIKYIPTHKVKCDKCGLEIIQTNVTQLQFLSFVRSMKWTIGNMSLCPSCNIKKKSREEQISIFDFPED